VPSGEDVVRVRARMMPGVQEYHLWPETGGYCQRPVCTCVFPNFVCSGQEVGHEWIFYDIGCSRSRVCICSVPSNLVLFLTS
jgi:hypothetical protein